MRLRPRNSFPGPVQGLGPLEQQVMDHVWDVGRPLRVSDVHAAFRTSFAYTTLMTTLDRLYKKGSSGGARRPGLPLLGATEPRGPSSSRRPTRPRRSSAAIPGGATESSRPWSRR
jgi:hypothetical protein